MSRTYRILIAFVVAGVAVGGYWKFLLTPKRAEAAKLEQQVTAQQVQLAQNQALLADYQKAKGSYRENYSALVRLGKAVPSDDDTRSLVVQLDAAAKRSGVDFDNIDTTAQSSGTGAGAGVTGAAAATKTPPGAINAGQFSAMPFSFSFTGDFDGLSNFFSRLERLVTVDGDKVSVGGRLLRLESISLQPADNGWPGLHAQIGASSYIVPQADAAAAPAPGAAGSTPTPGTTTSSATTTTASAGTSAANGDIR